MEQRPVPKRPGETTVHGRPGSDPVILAVNGDAGDNVHVHKGLRDGMVLYAGREAATGRSIWDRIIGVIPGGYIGVEVGRVEQRRALRGS